MFAHGRYGLEIRSPVSKGVQYVGYGTPEECSARNGAAN
jgi:hypothetical protein